METSLPEQGRHCLALSLLAVVWWAFGVVHPGYTSLFLLVLLAISKSAEPSVVFKLWTTPLMYLVIGGNLIAAAVEGAGLFHMVLGNVLAVMGIVTPAIIAYTAGSAISPIVASLIVYTAVNQQYLLPFHNMALLVGEGESGGGYGSAEVFKLGLPLTALVFIVTVLVQVPWWKAIGLIQ
jgi:di/tricarboxylate transporter